MASKTQTKVGHHAIKDYDAVTSSDIQVRTRELEFTYTFENFFHPFVGELIEKLNKESLPGLFDPRFLEELGNVTKTASSALPGTYYRPNPSRSKFVKTVFHDKKIDVTSGGPYANYNWELFFHIPLAIAVHLSKNQRFAEAQRWFHYIFDPTANDTSDAAPRCYWKFIAFREQGARMQIDELLTLLSKPTSELTDDEVTLKADVLKGYQDSLDHPFQPHRVARAPGRHLAYMYSVVMKYLDNLIAWGDHLFRQDTLETINEATQIYVLAANILGHRPEKIPVRGTVRPKTFAQLKQRLDAVDPKDRDPMGNALVELEGLFPFSLGIPTSGEGADAASLLFGIGRTLYFCIPRNDKLLGYWDAVADRLFKIRHCMNIEGVVRPLALFDPPLDPGMLVKAAAAGIDIGALVAGLNQPVSPVRAQPLIQKALELCAEVRNLGASLLSAIEKADGERLALLRQGHEIKIQQLQQDIRFLQWKQAQEGTESLLKSRASALERYTYYLRLLGQTADGSLVPETLALDRRALTEENFDETYTALVGQYEKEVPVRDHGALKLAGGGSPSGAAGATGPGRLSLTTSESDELDHLKSARDLGQTASIIETTVSALAFIPNPQINLQYWGLGGTVDLNVGTAMQKVVEITSKLLQMNAAWEREESGIVSRTASYERRFDDWILQSNLAARELRQLGRQVISSLIAEQIAHREYENVRRQIENAQEVDRFLREKFSNAELYAWMQGELSRLYYEYYRFAFDIARRAEQTMKRELMRPELDGQSLVKFNYWDGGRKGLLSGEALYLDVKRMELAFLENNKREFELTKHISLRQLNPLALLSLKVSGSCEFTIPEWVLDLDGPGHYMRRINSVSLSIPSVTGPYTSVSCTLSLLRSSLRKSPLLLEGAYARADGGEDTRFIDYYGTIQQIVTSGGVSDSGMFEANPRDERFLPFEGAGAIGAWKLELPKNLRQFDYNTISDVILHMRYTARQGGGLLGGEAVKHVEELIGDVRKSGLALLISLPHEFPGEWHKFTSPGNTEELVVRIGRDHFPYLAQGTNIRIESAQLCALDMRAQRLESVAVPVPPESTLPAITPTPAEEAVALTLNPEVVAVGAVLKREKTARIFLVMSYALES